MPSAVDPGRPAHGAARRDGLETHRAPVKLRSGVELRYPSAGARTGSCRPFNSNLVPPLEDTAELARFHQRHQASSSAQVPVAQHTISTAQHSESQSQSELRLESNEMLV